MRRRKKNRRKRKRMSRTKERLRASKNQDQSGKKKMRRMKNLRRRVRKARPTLTKMLALRMTCDLINLEVPRNKAARRMHRFSLNSNSLTCLLGIQTNCYWKHRILKL
jgi:hypothetical protein